MSLSTQRRPHRALPPSSYQLRWGEFLRLHSLLPRVGNPPQPRAIHAVDPYSAALLLFEPSGGLSVGSAVAVRCGRRYLLATAGHNLHGVRDRRQLWALLQTSRRFLRWPMPVERFRGRVKRNERGALVDVGWVELQDGPAAEQQGLSFLPLERLGGHQGQAGSPPSHHLVQGFPARLVKVEDQQSNGQHRRQLTLTPLSFQTTPVEAGANGRRSRGIALDYRGSGLDPHSGQPVLLPPAPGLSGGGIWQAEGGRYRLTGITRGWWPRSRQLRGTPIRHWLELVREDFPEP